jgi:hypothetical protein
MVINLYARRGFAVTTCLSDLELAVTEEALLANGVLLNTFGPGDHVPVIDQQIRTIRERVRGLLISMPFEKIPNIILIQSVVFSIMLLNFFVQKEECRPIFSHRLSGRHACKHRQGEH